jgi:hypothetical protein
LNIGSSGRNDIPKDAKCIAMDCGFSLIEEKNISFPTYKFTNEERSSRKEPLLIFKK